MAEEVVKRAPPGDPGALRTRGLTVEQRHAAFLEAQGWRRDQIAAAVGRTGVTISNWRKDPDYQAEVDLYVQVQHERLQKLFDAIRIEQLLAGRAGLNKLIKLLDAVDEQGNDKHGIQMESARALALQIRDAFDLGGPRRKRGGGDDEDGSGNQVNAGVIIVQRGEGDGMRIVDAADFKELDPGEGDG